MTFSLIKDLFDKWLVSTPDGKPFIPMPWDTEELWPIGEKPPLLPVYTLPLGRILGFCVAFLVVSLIFKFPLTAGISATILTIGLLAYRDAWRQSGALTISCETDLYRVHEHEKFAAILLLKNTTRARVSNCFLCLRFAGSVSGTQLVGVSSLAPFERREVKVEFSADGGMGTYELDQFKVITCDRFGLVPRCVKHELATKVEVLPEFLAMPPLKLTTSGMTAHSGTVEASLSGDSVSFLGTRFYRHGDSIRRIDWKKSERLQTLVVREFEHLNATDATIILDRRAITQFQYGSINSFEQVKDTVVTLARTLMGQRLRVRLVTDVVVTELGKGGEFLDYLINTVRDIKPTSAMPFHHLVARYRELVPAYSIAIPIFATVGLDLPEMMEDFLAWDHIHVQILPVILDAYSFDQKIAKMEDLGAQEIAEIRNLRGLYFPLAEHASYSGLIRKLSEKSLIVGPGETIGQVYARQLG